MKLGRYGLPLRSAVLARRRRRIRALAALSGLCLIGFVGAVLHEVWPRRDEVLADVASRFESPVHETAPVPASSARPVYRHSIVPGGAYSKGEVAAAMEKDAVVAAHYRDIDVDNVHAKTLTAPRAVYVSYRVGDRVYWTRNRVRLAAGEKVLTDGETEIRARCGNLLSDDAQQPVAAHEPPVAMLDETETGSSTMADARAPEGTLAPVPFLAAWSKSGVGVDTPELPGGLHGGPDPTLWLDGGGGGVVYPGASAWTTGGSAAGPLGGGERNRSLSGSGSNAGGSAGSGSNGGGSNGGGSNGGGSNGGGSNGDGSNGGGSSDDGLNGGGSNGGGSNDDGSNGGGSNGGGSNGDGSNGGGSNGGGANDGGSNGGGSNGGGDWPQPGDNPFTTTGGSPATTTGNVVLDTTGDGGEHTIPEPATMVLLGLGVCGAAARAARARRRQP